MQYIEIIELEMKYGPGMAQQIIDEISKVESKKETSVSKH